MFEFRWKRFFSFRNFTGEFMAIGFGDSENFIKFFLKILTKMPDLIFVYHSGMMEADIYTKVSWLFTPVTRRIKNIHNECSPFPSLSENAGHDRQTLLKTNIWSSGMTDHIYDIYSKFLLSILPLAKNKNKRLHIPLLITSLTLIPTIWRSALFGTTELLLLIWFLLRNVSQYFCVTIKRYF